MVFEKRQGPHGRHECMVFEVRGGRVCGVDAVLLSVHEPGDNLLVLFELNRITSS